MYYIHILIYIKFLDGLILRGRRRSFVLTTYYTSFSTQRSPAVLHLATRDHNPTVFLLVSCATYNAHQQTKENTHMGQDCIFLILPRNPFA